MRIALLMTVLPGLGTGLVLVLVAGLGLPMFAAWPQLAQAHGQIQTLGFVLVFIVAVALQLFPRFLAAPLQHADRAIWGSSVLALALILRLLGQPLEPGVTRALLLAAAAIGVPAGLVLAGSAFHGLSRRSVQPSRGPAAAWRRFVVIAGLAMVGVFALWVWTGFLLTSGYAVADLNSDEALIHLELLGFATCIVFAVSSRIFERFLLLRAHPSFAHRVPLLAACWGYGLAFTAAGWLLGQGAATWVRWFGSALELIVLLAWTWLIGLYKAPKRASGTPYVTDPTRRWVRLAFAFLLLGVALNTVLYAREALLGTIPTFLQLSAARHAIGQGFLLPLMVSMAARLLPIISADVLKHRLRLELTVDLLFVGAFVRVAAELIGGYSGLYGDLVAAGGAITICAFYAFAAQLWSSLGRLPSPKPAV